MVSCVFFKRVFVLIGRLVLIWGFFLLSHVKRTHALCNLYEDMQAFHTNAACMHEIAKYFLKGKFLTSGSLLRLTLIGKTPDQIRIEAEQQMCEALQ